jgi:hypothetical protein
VPGIGRSNSMHQAFAKAAPRSEKARAQDRSTLSLSLAHKACMRSAAGWLAEGLSRGEAMYSATLVSSWACSLSISTASMAFCLAALVWPMYYWIAHFPPILAHRHRKKTNFHNKTNGQNTTSKLRGYAHPSKQIVTPQMVRISRNLQMIKRRLRI